MKFISILEIANLMLEIASNLHNVSGKETLAGIAFIGTLILVLNSVKNINININVNFNKSEENKRK
ncbi:hypothetical protein [Priestia aryabhattai]|uniref:hypothetical protein n=1 Tax=Priestia aryabhattai TaxID=412384 RepID=UPI0008DC91ED|nr:hypothetical protein [Priestia aryabhattai]OHY73286.1 hypothetical protein BCV52_27175 [Priestia aryabhattai]